MYRTTFVAYFALAPVAALASTWLTASAADPRFENDRRLEAEVHDLGFWIADPSLPSINAQATFGNALPGVINSQRNRERSPSSESLSPLGLVTFRGRPDGPFDIDLRVTLGRFLAHWPPADVKTGRLRWLDAELKAPSDQATLPFVAAEHWFHAARQLSELRIKRQARHDAVLVYDAEVTITNPFPLKLEAVDGNFALINFGKHPLLDVFVSIPGEEGSRFVWLDQVEADPTSAKPAADQPAAASAASPRAAKEVAGGVVATVAGGVVAAVKLVPAQPIAQAGEPTPSTAAGTPLEPAAAPKGLTGKRTEIALSAPLPRTDPSYSEQTKGQFVARLLKSGLTQTESEFLASRYSKAIFESDKAAVLYRLHPAELEEKLPLAIEPEPRKIVRSTFVLVRNIDPQISANLKDLIAQLGSRSFREREQAEEQLLSMGRISVEPLKEAQKSADPEVVFRAKRILKAVGEQVTDD